MGWAGVRKAYACALKVSNQTGIAARREEAEGRRGGKGRGRETRLVFVWGG